MSYLRLTFHPNIDDFSEVKNVYYMSTNDELFERQAPTNDSQAWEDDNFSGLYKGSNSTFLTAYWNQNIKNASQELVVLFQEEDFANGITQARYTSNRNASNPWVANNFGFSQPKGSTFAMSLVSYRSGKHLMLYTVDDAKSLRQHEYTISSTDLIPGPVVALASEQCGYFSKISTRMRTILIIRHSNRSSSRATGPAYSHRSRQSASV